MVDPPSRSVRRGMAVRAPPHRRRIMTYPWPPRPGRRVMIVRAPRRACRSLTGLAPRKRRRVMADPPSCCRARWSMTDRAPPHGRRAMTYPSPPRRGRQVMAVRAPRSWCRTTIGPTTRLWRRQVTPWRAPARIVPIATTPLPARVSRLLQVVLPRVPATSHTPTHPQSHHTAEKNRAPYSQVPTYPQSRSTTHQAHPAIQSPPRPRSCSTAGTGFSLRHSSRAPPAPCPSFPRKQESIPSPGSSIRGRAREGATNY